MSICEYDLGDDWGDIYRCDECHARFVHGQKFAYFLNRASCLPCHIEATCQYHERLMLEIAEETPKSSRIQTLASSIARCRAALEVYMLTGEIDEAYVYDLSRTVAGRAC